MVHFCFTLRAQKCHGNSLQLSGLQKRESFTLTIYFQKIQMSSLGWRFDTIFPAPRPQQRRKLPQYPTWELPEREPVEDGFYRMTALDLGLSSGPSVRARNFQLYDRELTYRVVENDGTRQALMWLLMARNIFHQGLTEMPEAYITRLVFNENHRTVLLMQNGVVRGGITFRPFMDLDFAEIAFCVVLQQQQIRGFGSHLMAHVKTYLQAIGLHNILTYADNTAIGYFMRQGFTEEINFDPQIWKRCIKDYNGATLIHCEIRDDVDYMRINDVIDQQKRLVSGMLRDFEVVRLTEWPATEIKGIEIHGKPVIDRNRQMKLIVEKLKLHSKSWPFRKPVKDAEGYYEVVKKPMDLQTLEENVNKGKYQTIEQFEEDTRLIFSNCYLYNIDGNVYSRTARELEQYFNSLMFEFKEGTMR